MTIRKRRLPAIHTGVLLGYAVLTVFMTWPLILHLASSVPGWPGDNMHYVWLLWWFKRAIVDLHASPLFNPFVFFPQGLEMARAEMTWANTILALPLTTFWGPVVAYNSLILLSFILSGFATYLWVWRLTGSYAAGFIAGVVFAFSPYRMAHLPGHLPLMATQWLPFSLYALEELYRSRRLRFAALAGAFFALNAWASWYYFYFALIAVPLYLLLRLGNWRDRLRSRFFWQATALGLAVACLLIAPAAWPFLKFHQEGEMQHAFSTMDDWGANPTDFVVPNLLHPLWGERMRDLVPFQSKLGVEKSLYLGSIPLLLSLIALWKKHGERPVRALGGLALGSFILALGPTLHWAGQRVYLTIPPGAMALLYYLGITPYLTPRLDPTLLMDMQLNHYIFIPLPSLLLYLFVPFTSSMRVIARFGVITVLAVAALAGYGLIFIRERWGSRQRRWVLPSLVVGLILFEFLAVPYPYRMTRLQPRAVDRWLARQPSGVVAELPVEIGLRPLNNYYASTIHQHATILGPTAMTFHPPILEERRQQLASFPDATTLQTLQDWGTTYLLIHTDKVRDPAHLLDQWEMDGRLRLIRCFDALCVYLLPPP